MELKIDNVNLMRGNTAFSYHAHITESISGVYGPSGAGKTTLLNIICGIEKPDSGRIEFNGRVLYDSQRRINVPEHHRNIGVVFQQSYLFPHLNVARNLAYSKPYVKNRPQPIGFDTVVSLLDIEHLLSRKPMQLSGGERRRVAIGRALLSQPGMLLMDEPFSNLDRARRRRLIGYLLEINRELDLPMLIISHDMEDLLTLTRSLLIVDGGTVVTAGDFSRIAESTAAGHQDIHDDFLNLFELHHLGSLPDSGLHEFSPGRKHRAPVLRTTATFPARPMTVGTRVRFRVRPDDIALATAALPAASIQNQLRGTVVRIHPRDHDCFVTVDCNGIELLVKVTNASVKRLGIRAGQTLFCLMKANALDAVHVYGDR